MKPKPGIISIARRAMREKEPESTAVLDPGQYWLPVIIESLISAGKPDSRRSRQLANQRVIVRVRAREIQNECVGAEAIELCFLFRAGRDGVGSCHRQYGDPCLARSPGELDEATNQLGCECERTDKNHTAVRHDTTADFRSADALIIDGDAPRRRETRLAARQSFGIRVRLRVGPRRVPGPLMLRAATTNPR